MRIKLKESFLEKSGEESGWKFGKFHAVEHCVATIILCGWIETTSCQSGERVHKELLKCLAGIKNNLSPISLLLGTCGAIVTSTE